MVSTKDVVRLLRGHVRCVNSCLLIALIGFIGATFCSVRSIHLYAIVGMLTDPKEVLCFIAVTDHYFEANYHYWFIVLLSAQYGFSISTVHVLVNLAWYSDTTYIFLV